VSTIVIRDAFKIDPQVANNAENTRFEKTDRDRLILDSIETPIFWEGPMKCL